ncbi:MAG: TyeA family type III secretion system gatekeeper subunit [Kistimonas sp.]|nr:TyeA family type III secretion system gatekeeper subunit [Kistimonas sp.]
MYEPSVKKGVLVAEILGLLNQRWVSSSDVETIPEKMGIPADKLAIKIFILNHVLEAFRKVPEQYFKEDEHRENILESVQEALDDLIEDEEQEESDDEDEDDIGMDFDI